jgi:hypothetical protein
MQQLSLMKPEIIEKLNRNLGRETVKDLTLRLGEVETSPGEASEERPVRAALTREERETIEHAVQDIGDHDVREAIRRLFEKEAQTRKRR